MRNEIRREGHPRGERSRGKDGLHRGERSQGRDGSHRGERSKGEHRGPKTFRRGRAIAFLEMMNLKRATIKQQLEEPEFQSINQILVGELKMLELMINEFTQLFEIHGSELEHGDGSSASKTDVELETEEDGMKLDETN
jgi:hypothetical protein